MQDLEQLKEHQEYKLTKLMINGVARMVASNCINSGYEVYLGGSNKKQHNYYATGLYRW